jgi:hypothetical protein
MSLLCKIIMCGKVIPFPSLFPISSQSSICCCRGKYGAKGCQFEVTHPHPPPISPIQFDFLQFQFPHSFSGNSSKSSRHPSLFSFTSPLSSLKPLFPLLIFLPFFLWTLYFLLHFHAISPLGDRPRSFTFWPMSICPIFSLFFNCCPFIQSLPHSPQGKPSSAKEMPPKTGHFSMHCGDSQSAVQPPFLLNWFGWFPQFD